MKIIDASGDIVDTDNLSRKDLMEIAGRICYHSEDKINPESADSFIGGVFKKKHHSVSEFAVYTILIPNGYNSAGFFHHKYFNHKYLTIDFTSDGIYITGTVRAFREEYQRCNDNYLLNSMVYCLKKKNPLFFEDLDIPEYTNLVEHAEFKILTVAEVDALPVALLKRHRWVLVKYIVNRAISHELVRHRPCSWLQESQRYCRYSDDKFGNDVTFISPDKSFPALRNDANYGKWFDAMKEAERVYLELLDGGASPQAARTVLPNSCKTELFQWCNLEEYDTFFGLRTTPMAEPSMREVTIPLFQKFKDKFPTVFGY